MHLPAAAERAWASGYEHRRGKESAHSDVDLIDSSGAVFAMKGIKCQWSDIAMTVHQGCSARSGRCCFAAEESYLWHCERRFPLFEVQAVSMHMKAGP